MSESTGKTRLSSVPGLRRRPTISLGWRKMEPTIEKNVQRQSSQDLPRTAGELHMTWRGLAAHPNDRYRLLLDTGEKRLGQMFSTEVPFGLLSEILIALDDGFRDEDACTIYGLLQLLTRTPRFALNISFLSATEHDALHHLCTRLTGISANASIPTTALQEENENGQQPAKSNQPTSSKASNRQPAGVDFSKKDLHNTDIVSNLEKLSFSSNDVENLKQSFSD
uniref:coiled-coil domain-containing protein 103 isoform X2 n=1 Tax=Myxine glutinosa TaxID=7769 RepID=UPI00358EEC91